MWGFMALALFIGFLMITYWEDLNDLARWWIEKRKDE